MGLKKHSKGRVEIHSHIADAEFEEADIPNLNAEIYPGRQTALSPVILPSDHVILRQNPLHD